MSIDSVRLRLEGQDFATLIGVREDDWFEAKQNGCYDLNTAAGRYELAKDVCAFANAGGGFIVIGLQTQHLADEQTDEVSALDLFQEDAFNISQYVGVITEYVYPHLASLRVTWLSNSPTPDLGIEVIEIPLQDARRKPFLTTRVVDDGIHQRQIIFGWSRRNQSANDPLSISEIHKAVKSGMDPLPERLTRIEEKLDSVLQNQRVPQAPAEAPSQRLARRIEELLDESPE